jgi:hypothetical protein
VLRLRSWIPDLGFPDQNLDFTSTSNRGIPDCIFRAVAAVVSPRGPGDTHTLGYSVVFGCGLSYLETHEKVIDKESGLPSRSTIYETRLLLLSRDSGSLES